MTYAALSADQASWTGYCFRCASASPPYPNTWTGRYRVRRWVCRHRCR